MKIDRNSPYFKWGITAFFVIVASICFYYLMFHGANIKQGIARLVKILMPIVLGLVIAYLMTPVLNWLEYRVILPLCDRLKIRESKRRKNVVRGVSVVATIFILVFVIGILIYMLLSQIVPSIMSIASNFDHYTSNIYNWVMKLLEDNPEVEAYALRLLDRYSVELENWVNGKVLPKSTELLRTFSLSIIGLFGSLLNFVIGIILSVYIMVSKERFAGQAKKLAYALFQKETANIVISNFRFTHKMFSGFLVGKMLDSIIIGLLCFIGTTLMMTPYAVLVSVVIGVTNVIPFFGPWIGAIPTTFLVFIVDPLHPLNAIYYVLFILILQQVDGNLIGPKILGQTTGLSGFWVIFAITLFGGVFGVPGMIVGVPIFAIIYAGVKSLVNIALKKRDLPLETAEYLDVEKIDSNGQFHTYVPKHRMPRPSPPEKKKKQ